MNLDHKPDRQLFDRSVYIWLSIAILIYENAGFKLKHSRIYYCFKTKLR